MIPVTNDQFVWPNSQRKKCLNVNIRLFCPKTMFRLLFGYYYVQCILCCAKKKKKIDERAKNSS